MIQHSQQANKGRWQLSVLVQIFQIEVQGELTCFYVMIQELVFQLPRITQIQKPFPTPLPKTAKRHRIILKHPSPHRSTKGASRVSANQQWRDEDHDGSCWIAGKDLLSHISNHIDVGLVDHSQLCAVNVKESVNLGRPNLQESNTFKHHYHQSTNPLKQRFKTMGSNIQIGWPHLPHN